MKKMPSMMNAAHAVDQAEPSSAPPSACHDRRRPGGLGEERRHAGQHQRHDAEGESQVGDAPAPGRSAGSACVRLRRQAVGADMRHVLALPCDPAIRGSTRGRNAAQKKAKTPISRAIMNFVVIHISRILGEVVAVAVRAEGERSRRSPSAGPSCRCGTSGRSSAGSSDAPSTSGPSTAGCRGCRGSRSTWRYRHSRGVLTWP